VTGDAITNAQRAVAAFAAISAYAQASDQPGSIAPRDDTASEPRLAQDRLSGLLCALRHHADQISGLRFDEILTAAGEEYERQRGGRISPARVTAAARAIEVHDHQPPRRYQGGAWPPDALADLRHFASARGMTVEEATAHFSAALISDLRHYADDHDVDFAEALARSERTYTEQRLQEEGPFPPGQNTRDVAILAASPATSPFRPVATRQGVVTSMSDAEWLLVRTAARLREIERRGFTESALPRDTSDTRALSEALAAVCGLTRSEILGRLARQIMARAEEIENGAAAAAEIGHRHGIVAVEPYCRLDADGDDSRLMEAFGETEWTTDANTMHRLALIQAYAMAYTRARKNAGAAPAQLAERGFPREPGESFGHDSLSRSADAATATPRAEPQRPRQKPS
jgi:hypothetical protein